MAHGGSALGRHEGKTIFVPYAIPGERVIARITQDRGRIAFAEGISLLDASVDRVYPVCKHFGPHKCGRCHWQHIDYQAQVALKFDVLADQLSRVGKFDDATLERVLRPIVPAPDIWHYNAHMTLLVTEGGELGFPGADAGTIMPIEECYLLDRELLDLYHQLDIDVSSVKKLRLQRGSDGAMMIILSVDQEEDVPELLTELPVSINALLPDNEPVNLIGSSHVDYTVKGRAFKVTAGSDFRPNIAALDALVDAVVDSLALDGHGSVLDLYAGVGLFSAFIAPHAALVTLVESFPPAATNADHNLSDFEHVEVIEGAVEEVLDALDEFYDAAVVDPPSSGMTGEALDALVALEVPRIVYVSSDPATLARDGQRLLKHGYALESVQPFDLAPHTYYIDAVAVFVRA